MVNMVSDMELKQMLFDYTYKKYENRLQEFHDRFCDEFPYKYDDLPAELYIKNFVEWLIAEKTIPETGKTIVEEFVDECQLDEETKQKILQMGDITSSKFVVLSKDRLNLKIKDVESKKTYNVTLYSENPHVGINTLITGRIHPSGKTYRFSGIFLAQNSPLILDTDVLMEHLTSSKIKDAEEIVLSPKSKLTAILNKYRADWVDGICDKLSINVKEKKNVKVKMIASKMTIDLASVLNSIPEKSKEALKLVLDNDGYVKYNKLKNYDDEITFWWKDEPPTSTIGILRLSALLVVGEMPMSGRMYRVALIPYEIRDELQNLL